MERGRALAFACTVGAVSNFKHAARRVAFATPSQPRLPAIGAARPRDCIKLLLEHDVINFKDIRPDVRCAQKLGF